MTQQQVAVNLRAIYGCMRAQKSLNGPPRGTEKDSKAIKEKTKKGQRIKHMLSI